MNAVHPKLDSVTTDEFAIRMGVVSNPRAIHRRLRSSKEVGDIRQALLNGEITEQSIRRFIAELFRQYVPGQLFPHDIALSAIAVAIETRAGAFASDVICDLSRLRLAEIPMASRVARESFNVQQRLAGNKSKLVMMSSPIEGQPNQWQLKSDIRPVDVDQADQKFELEVS